VRGALSFQKVCLASNHVRIEKKRKEKPSMTDTRASREKKLGIPELSQPDLLKGGQKP
jgi:hypothetical protein